MKVYDTYEMCSPLASVNVLEPTSREQREYYENLNAHKAMSKTLGGFVMVLYFNNEKLYGEEIESFQIYCVTIANVGNLYGL